MTTAEKRRPAGGGETGLCADARRYADSRGPHRIPPTVGRVLSKNHLAPEPYLLPYLRAADKHGAEFPSLLWASPQTQAARFDAVARLANLHHKSVLDVGCGRADLLDFLLDRNVRPSDYTGIEAVEDLAAAAEAKRRRFGDLRVVRADFVREPLRLFVAADVVVFSGSLNTIEDEAF